MKWTHVGWLLAGLLTASASPRAADVTVNVNGGRPDPARFPPSMPPSSWAISIPLA